ncbi:MAG TPA: hypothetical protein VK360_04380, partial [Acidimicrobiales bacterium]|nr:hypothetical protein [Acidimicrobiales bacterium]
RLRGVTDDAEELTSRRTFTAAAMLAAGGARATVRRCPAVDTVGYRAVTCEGDDLVASGNGGQHGWP